MIGVRRVARAEAEPDQEKGPVKHEPPGERWDISPLRSIATELHVNDLMQLTCDCICVAAEDAGSSPWRVGLVGLRAGVVHGMNALVGVERRGRSQNKRRPLGILVLASIMDND